MKTILIIGSFNNLKQFIEIKDELIKNSIETLMTEDIGQSIPSKSYSSLRKYRNLLGKVNSILVINYEKDGIKGYIGKHTLCEIYDAYLEHKQIFLLNKPSETNDELALFSPIILEGGTPEDKITFLIDKLKDDLLDCEEYKKTKGIAQVCIDFFKGNEVVRWYQKKSKKPKRRYKSYNAFIIVGNSLIAAILLLSSDLNLDRIFVKCELSANDIGILITILISVLVSIFSGLLNFFNYKETWKSFKTTQFNIEKEILLFELKMVEIDNLPDCNSKATQLINALNSFVKNVYDLHELEVDMYFSSFNEKEERK